MKVPQGGSVNISQMPAASMLQLCLGLVNLRFSTRTTVISHHRCNISRAWGVLPGLGSSPRGWDVSVAPAGLAELQKGMLRSSICGCAVFSLERVPSPALSSHLCVLCNCRRAVDPNQEGTSVCLLIIHLCAVKGRGKKYPFFSMN